MVAKKKGTGGNLNRSQVVTVRLDPKLKFAAELAARKQRRTISSFIEWAVEEAIAHVWVNDGVNINLVLDAVWDVEEADRFVKLVMNCPELLTYDEEKLWKIIREFKPFWKGPGIKFDNEIINIDLLRHNWPVLYKIISGEATREDLSEIQ